MHEMERDHERTEGGSRRAVAAAALFLTAAAVSFAGGLAASAESWQGRSHDAWVDGKIEASFALSPYLNPFTIDTHVDDGVVRLTGAVDSQIDKDLAEQIAEGVDGVKQVKNDLVVKSGAGKETAVQAAARGLGRHVEDATITARVKFALLRNASVDGLDIDVDTRDGAVSLDGAVGSREERDLAERIARNTEGVRRVANHLSVTGES